MVVDIFLSPSKVGYSQWRWPVMYSNIVDVVISFPHGLIGHSYQISIGTLNTLDSYGYTNYPTAALMGIPVNGLNINKVGVNAYGAHGPGSSGGSLLLFGY